MKAEVSCTLADVPAASHKMPTRYCTPPDERDVHVLAEFLN